jgi:hypothetical protein
MNTTHDSFAFFQKRYKDAYIVSKVTSFLGYLIQFGAIGLAILLIVAGLFAASRMISPDGTWSPFAYAAAAIGFMSGVVSGALFYVLGVLISAQGQIILATLDTAVSCTPLLSNEEKSSIITRRTASKP